MGIVLALISICLTIAAFYWILLLTQRVKVLEEKGFAYNMDEIEEQLDSYLKAIREENTRFIKAIEAREKAGLNMSPKVTEPTSVTPPIPETESAWTKPEQPEWTPPLDVEEPIDRMETSIMSRVLQLKDEGLESEAIAKRLGLGKGEVALMLKMHEKR